MMIPQSELSFIPIIRRRALIIAVLVAAVLFVSTFALTNLYTGHAQGDTTITVQGILKAINGNQWTVGDTSFDIDVTTAMTGYPMVGSTVKVVFVQRADGRRIAVSIVLVVVQTNQTPTVSGTPPTATATSTSTATSTADGSATPEGSVTPSASPTAIPFVTIVIEGPVEKVDISVNVVVVYGMKVRLKDDDPVKMKIKVGNWLRVRGNFEHEDDGQIIVVAVVVVIIDAPTSATIIIAPPGQNGQGSQGGKGGKGHHEDDDD